MNPVRPWTDHPMCPKCTQRDINGQFDYHYCEIGDDELLILTCKSCGFQWPMEVAYESWEGFDKEQGEK